jgi:hypothetical protein
MSGRSGYRKTDAKRPRNPFTQPRPREDYVLRFVLPKLLSFALSPGAYGYGVTVGFNDIAFVAGHNPGHCCQLAADFLDRVGARELPQIIPAGIVKLLPCPAHRLSPQHGFSPIGGDLEGVHDNVSRNAHNWRTCTIDVGASEISFHGATPKPVIHDFSDRSASDRRRA